MRKKLLVLIIILCVGSMMSMAASDNGGKGRMYVSPLVGINSFAVPFGVSVELGIKDKFGIGGTLLYQSWDGFTLITPSVQGVYHFTGIKARKIDLYAGLSLGFSIFSAGNVVVVGTSGLYLSPFAGIRYFLSAKMALTARLNISAVGDWSGVGTLIGVSFKVK